PRSGRSATPCEACSAATSPAEPAPLHRAPGVRRRLTPEAGAVTTASGGLAAAVLAGARDARLQDEQPAVDAADGHDARLAEVGVVAPRAALERRVVVLRVEVEVGQLAQARARVAHVVHAQTGRVVRRVGD